MGKRVDPNLMSKLESYGVGDWNACYHCGNCTAMCPLTEQGSLFPRKGIRTAQMGLTDKLMSSPEPWLCYYCGECSETCPRDANPGEMMMAIRRFLTSLYDWTGIAGKLYRSKAMHIIMVMVLFFGVLGAFFAFAKIPVLSDPANVELNSFAPVPIIQLVDEIMLGILSFFLITNMINMFHKVILKDKSVKIPISLYFKEVWAAIWNFFTQWRFRKCDHKFYWFRHLFLMLSYVGMFILIIFFMDWFQTDKIHPITHPQRWLGYLITIGLLLGTISFMYGRARKKLEIFKFSHHSDWIWLVLLFLIALTGILVHIFRLAGMAHLTYYMYALHLAVEVPMVVTFVAFSKWSHLAYRPLALFFANLKKSALALQESRS